MNELPRLSIPRTRPAASAPLVLLVWLLVALLFVSLLPAVLWLVCVVWPLYAVTKAVVNSL